MKKVYRRIVESLRSQYRSYIPLKFRLQIKSLRVRILNLFRRTKAISSEQHSLLKPLPVPIPDAETEIIKILAPLVMSHTLHNYNDLWESYNFTVTPHYNRISWQNNVIQFNERSTVEQVQNFTSDRGRTWLKNAEEIIPLIRSLIDSDRYREHFDVWANAGFHITPLPRPLASEGFLPNVFVLGAAKCGTTTLHAYMEAIPSVCMSEPKEPFFMEAEYELGLAHYQRLYFAHWQGEPLIGDARQRNLYFQHVPKRIYETNPQAKLIVILRNPIERAYSHWWHRYSRGYESLSFENAVMEDLARVEAGYSLSTFHEMKVYKATLDISGKGIYRTYLDGGYYFEQISRYLNYFPRNQLKIFFYEGLAKQPYWLIRELEEFLGVDYYTPENFHIIHANSAHDDKQDKHRVPVTPKFHSWLQEHYRSHNEQLATFTGRDLSHWFQT